VAHTFAELTQLTPEALEAVLAAGTTPSFSSIVDHEFRGWNVFSGAVVGAVGGVLGIQRFAKGFFVRGTADLNAAAVDALPFVEGYNVKIRRGISSEPWTAIPDDVTPTRHSFYRVERANEGAGRLGRHPQALLLDYSQGHPKPSVVDGGGLRDFVVQVDVDNPDLLLGKAYMSVGPVTSAVGFFVLERLRRSGFRA
jgi:hypothetical protein